MLGNIRERKYVEKAFWNRRPLRVVGDIKRGLVAALCDAGCVGKVYSQGTAKAVMQIQFNRMAPTVRCEVQNGNAGQDLH